MFPLTRSLALTGLLALAACGAQPGPASSVPTAPSSASSISSVPTSPGTVQARLALIAIDDNGAAGDKIGCDDSAVVVTCTVPNRGTPVESALRALLDDTTDWTAANCQAVAAGAVPSVPSVSSAPSASTLPSTSITAPGATTITVGTLALVNPLGDKNLAFAGYATTDDEATVRLSGTPTIGGTCEPPRLTAQIEETVRANDEDIDDVAIVLNGDDDAWDDLSSGQ